MTLRFTEDQFTPTKFSTAAEKAKCATDFMRFFRADCPQTMFSKKLYYFLHQHAGHIAHYDNFGFYSEWFSSVRKQMAFLTRFVESANTFHGCSPDWKDVERALLKSLEEEQILTRYALRLRHALNDQLVFDARRALLALSPELRTHVIEEVTRETNAIAASPQSATVVAIRPPAAESTVAIERDDAQQSLFAA